MKVIALSLSLPVLRPFWMVSEGSPSLLLSGATAATTIAASRRPLGLRVGAAAKCEGDDREDQGDNKTHTQSRRLAAWVTRPH